MTRDRPISPSLRWIAISFACSASALAAASAAPVGTVAPARGAPLICFEIEVADATPLPFAEGVDCQSKVTAAELPMAIHSSGEPQAGPAGAAQLTSWEPLLSVLESAVVAFQTANIDHGEGGSALGDWRAHLRHAMVAPAPLLERNLVSTFGVFVGQHDLESMRAAVAGDAARRDH